MCRVPHLTVTVCFPWGRVGGIGRIYHCCTAKMSHTNSKCFVPQNVGAARKKYSGTYFGVPGYIVWDTRGHILMYTGTYSLGTYLDTRYIYIRSRFYFPASGQAVVTGVVPSPPRFFRSIFIARGVQQSHCSSKFRRNLLTHALALSASHFVYKKKSPRFYSSMHSGAFELTKLTYTRLEDNLIRHRGDRLRDPRVLWSTRVHILRYPGTHSEVPGYTVWDTRVHLLSYPGTYSGEPGYIRWGTRVHTLRYPGTKPGCSYSCRWPDTPRLYTWVPKGFPCRITHTLGRNSR